MEHVEHTSTATDHFGVVAWLAFVAAYVALRAVRRPIGGFCP